MRVKEKEPLRVSHSPMRLRSKLLIALACVPAICFGVIMILHLCGLVRLYSVPTAAMTPAVAAGDHIVMERLTFLFRQPRRGDIVVFKTDGIATLRASTFYIKRVAGEPGDHVQISDGKLFINNRQVSLSNAVGEISYDLPLHAMAMTNVVVPNDCYFLLGDNSKSSLDSRFFGSVPRGNIIGRISFCYWPRERVGGIK